MCIAAALMDSCFCVCAQQYLLRNVAYFDRRVASAWELQCICIAVVRSFQKRGPQVTVPSFGCWRVWNIDVSWASAVAAGQALLCCVHHTSNSFAFHEGTMED